MHAVERRVLVPREELRRAHVRRKHALLDQLVGVVAHHGHDADDLALDVELELHFDAVEIDRAARFAGALQRVEQRVEIGEPGQQRLRRARRARGIRQPAPHLRVGEPRARVHHGRVELVLRDPALGGHVHVADHAEPVDIRLERAELVRQRLGQHRDHAAREIDRRAALARVAVQRIAVLHVMRDVGDRDDQPEPLALGARSRRRRRNPSPFRRRW